MNNYKPIKEKFDYSNNIEKFISFERFIVEYKNLNIIKKQDDKINSPEYNIFNILKILRPETNLHSPFLLSLLDCQGHHGQNDLFYKLFLESFINEPQIRNRFVNIKPEDYFIKCEQYIKTDDKKGWIDILIKSNNTSNKFVVIIENKWDSPDSSIDQVYKYYSYYKSIGYEDYQILTIYLTKHGGEPDNRKMSLDFKNYIEQSKHKTFYSISYNYNIKKWLQLSLKHSKSEKVNNLINQYLILMNYEW